MTKRLVFLVTVLVLVVGITAPSHADVLRVPPTVASVMPEGPSGEARIALAFDLGGLRAGANRVIRAAVLDWTVTGLSESSVSTFQLQEIKAAWTPEGIQTGRAPTLGEDAASEWQLHPEDYARLGGFVRLDLGTVVSDWASGRAENFGVVVSTSELSEAELLSQVSNATLVIYYTFAR